MDRKLSSPVERSFAAGKNEAPETHLLHQALETGFKLRPGCDLASGVFFVSLGAPGAW